MPFQQVNCIRYDLIRYSAIVKKIKQIYAQLWPTVRSLFSHSLYICFIFYAFFPFLAQTEM